MIDDVLGLLACPVCGPPAEASLRRHGSTLRCPAGHCFDVARQGYAALLTGSRPPTADTAEMVKARVEFLDAGHYTPVLTAVADTVRGAAPRARALLDAGTGTGHYLAAALDALPDAVGLGLDTSVPALRRAARTHPRAAAASWDTWRPLPVRTGAVDVVLDVFAPRNAAEFHRVLRPDGALVLVTPLPRHLAELRPLLGVLDVDPDKDERVARTLGGHFTEATSDELRFALRLDAADARRLAAMTPSAHHLDPDAIAERLGCASLEVTVAVRVAVLRPRGDAVRS